MSLPAPARTEPLESLFHSMQSLGRLVSRERAVEAVLRRSRIDLGRADVHLLRTLEEVGGPIRLGDLADRLAVDAPTVTRRVRQLEARRLLRRRPDPLDRRAQLVELTAAGRRSLEQATAAYRAWLEEVLDGWSCADQEQLARLLERLTESVLGKIGTP